MSLAGSRSLTSRHFQAKELKKKAAKADREVRDYARKHPQAMTGIVGAGESCSSHFLSELELTSLATANVAVLAGVGLAMYNNWHLPRWNRQTVTLSVLGLAALFGAEGALGYWEYEQNEKEQGRK